MSTDRKNIICFYRYVTDSTRTRIQKMVEEYQIKIFDGNGSFFTDVISWPRHYFDNEDGFGVIFPAYPDNFFFSIGSSDHVPMKLKGQEKHGQWFTGVYQRACLHKEELSDWSSYIRICLQLARAIRKIHNIGLFYSQLSLLSVLVDPIKRTVCLIDFDAVVIPNLYPPSVLGTPGFIAPEVFRTQSLKVDDQNKYLPCRETDLYTLAVLIYSLLLYRHPLRGPKVHDANDPIRDENLMMGQNALFIEHPTDQSNRPTKRWLDKQWKGRKISNVQIPYLPWTDPNQVPYTALGPYLSPLMKQAFVDGLHDPKKRPSANLWEQALVRTADNILPCSNSACPQKWFIYNNETRPTCPFCKTDYHESIPVIDFYFKRDEKSFVQANHRMVARHGTRIYKWHTNEYTPTGENLRNEDRKPQGVIFKRDNKWQFLNQEIHGLRLNAPEQRDVSINETIEITEGMQLLFENCTGGRLGILRFTK